MYQDKRKEQADKMNYFDCHVDTLTEILKPGDTLDENSCNLDLKRVGITHRFLQSGKMR